MLIRLLFWNQTGIRTTLPNCTEDLDKLAWEFFGHLYSFSLSSPDGDGGTLSENHAKHKAQKIADKVEKMSEKSSEMKRKSAKIYHQYMKKGLERGPQFYESEQTRIQNLLTNPKESERITETKKRQIQAHFNVLQSFRLDHYPRNERAARNLREEKENKWNERYSVNNADEL